MFFFSRDEIFFQNCQLNTGFLFCTDQPPNGMTVFPPFEFEKVLLADVSPDTDGSRCSIYLIPESEWRRLAEEDKLDTNVIYLPQFTVKPENPFPSSHVGQKGKVTEEEEQIV